MPSDDVAVDVDIVFKVGNFVGLALPLAALIALLIVRGGRGPRATTLGALGSTAMVLNAAFGMLREYDVVEYFDDIEYAYAVLFILYLAGLGLVLFALVTAGPRQPSPHYPSGQFPMAAPPGGQHRYPQYGAPQQVPHQAGSPVPQYAAPPPSPNLPPPPTFGAH